MAEDQGKPSAAAPPKPGGPPAAGSKAPTASDRDGMSLGRKIRYAAAAIGAIVLVIVFAQNSESVPVHFLFATLTMPMAVLLIITALIGIAAGLLIAGFWRRKGDKDKKKA